MRKTSIPNKLKHKQQRVCEENKKEKRIRRNKRLPVKNLRLKDRIWKPVEEQ